MKIYRWEREIRRKKINKSEKAVRAKDNKPHNALRNKTGDMIGERENKQIGKE